MIGSFHAGNTGVLPFSLVFIAVTAVRKFSNILFRDAEVARSNRVAPILFKCFVHNELCRLKSIFLVSLGKFLGKITGLSDPETLYVAI